MSMLRLRRHRGRLPHVHRNPDQVAESHRMRAYWKYHVDGSHKIPREGVRPDHYYACEWCDPAPMSDYDGETEVFHLPSSAAGNPMAAVMGRLG